MKKLSFRAIAALAAPILLLLGCETRSISDSGYRGHFAWGSGNRYYQGELNEMDVLGASAGQKVSEADIRKALSESGSVRVRSGESLLVVQSGAIAPDGAMVDALTHLGYKVQGFSGVPPAPDSRAEYSRKLRLAAAQGGLKHILCYWGTLESTREDQATKTVSWVPIAGSFVPDQTQRMRINVRATLIDVASGRWSTITAKSSENAAFSPSVLRESSDQKQVEKLKAEGYAS
ncbi:MAG: aminopeptidase, partial [Verrucomicrobia bacterium]|nr:aminopeptidase [Verrucomicrobiota bacterium]